MDSFLEEIENEAEKESRLKITEVIDAYDAVLEGNKELDARYKVEEDHMIKRLRQVQLELRELKLNREKRKEPEKNESSYCYYNAGKPYFKDRKFNHPPDNEDTLIMKQYRMYDFSNVMSVSGWTVGDRSRFLSTLLELAKEAVKKRLLSEIALLQKVENKNQTITGKIEKLRNDLLTVKSKTFEDLDMKDVEFDWDEVAYQLNRRHSASEYKSMWYLFFHPSINKKPWNPTEHRDLQRLAQEAGMQDWEAIAKALNTNRTGYQCFVYYRTNMDHAATGRRWTTEEMDKLRQVIQLNKEEYHIPWGKVAALMSNRTKVQCYNKYLRMVEARKGRFLEEEDAVIRNFVNVYKTDYKHMAQYLYGRSSIQCRVRHGLLNKKGISATWSSEDDKKLLQVIAIQDNSCSFATAAKYFPGKDRANLRSRYNTLKRWMRRHPAMDTREAPRRAARRLAHGEPTTNLITALHNLRKKINELSNMPATRYRRQNNRLSRQSSHFQLDASLKSTVSVLLVKKQIVENGMPKSARGPAIDSESAPELDKESRDACHVRSLRNVLVMLNACLADREGFYNSKMGQGFKELEEEEDRSENSREQVMRCYSKAGAQAAVPRERPDLFSGNDAGRRKYMFPPNFATVTASRVILTHVHKQLSERGGCQAARSAVLGAARGRGAAAAARGALARLSDRFTDLFTWPYMLSNKPPHYYSGMAAELSLRRRDPPPPRRSGVALPAVPAVTIPHVRHFTEGDIDLTPLEEDDLSQVRVDMEDMQRGRLSPLAGAGVGD